jgi:uncharacterized surface anchored protein
MTLLPAWGGPLAAQAPVVAPDQTTSVGRTFRVAGTLVNAISGAPLGRARVSLIEVRGSGRGAAMVTSEDGRFEFTAVPAGKFSLSGAKTGFLPGTYDQHGPLSTAIVTSAGVDTEHLTLRLTPQAMLAGKILDERGEAVRSAIVTLFRPGNREGLHQVNLAGRVVTDDQGSFELTRLSPGNYFLSVSAKPWYAVHPRSTPQAEGANYVTAVDAGLDVAYPTTFYNGATESDGATPISLKGGERRQVDVHLGPVPSLHFTIRLPTGDDRVRNGNVPILEKRTFGFMDFVQPGDQSESGGILELSGIPAGKYSLVFRGAAPARTAEVNLQRDGEEIDISKAEPSADVKVTLRVESGEVFPEQLFVGLRDAQMRFVAGQQADDGGRLTLMEVPAGKYLVSIAAGEGEYSVRRLISGGQEITDRKISVIAGVDQDLTVFLARGAVSVEGFVKRDGKPVAGAMVVLVPKDVEGQADAFRRDQSDLDGSFIVRDLVPGTYSLIAVEDGWDVEWRTPNALNRYLGHGQELTIGPLMRGTVRLPEAVESVR